MRPSTALATLAVLALTVTGFTQTRDLDYVLTEREGPWMICVASFRGDNDHEKPELRPMEMARRLVDELRTQYKLQAYVYNRSAEQQEQERKRREEWKERYNNAPLRRIRIPDEYAVLVGNYKDMDEARKAQAKLKKQPAPKSVAMPRVEIGKPAERQGKNVSVELNGATGVLNPLASSWVCRNPLTPRPPEPTEEPFDPFLTKLNDGQPYNLLKNRKPYTLVVKVYEGATIIQGMNDRPSVFSSAKKSKSSAQDRLMRLFDQSGGKDLDNAGSMAHQLAKGLRHKDLGYESYVLHTRTASLVCVGGFIGPSDPELTRMQKQLGGLKVGVIDLLPLPAPYAIPRPK